MATDCNQLRSHIITCQRGSARQCCKSHMHFKGKTPFLTARQPKNYSLHGDESWHDSLCPGYLQMCQVSLLYLWGFRPHKHVKYNLDVLFFIFVFVFLGTRTARTAKPILMVDGLKRVFWRKEVPFVGPR
jgi:hypothetical protein